jgi:hypothetical protein
MKKLILKLRNTKGKRVKTAVSIPARFVTSAERGRKSMACVDTEFFKRVHTFVDCVAELFHVRWDRTQHEIQAMDLQNELLKRRPRIVIDEPADETRTLKGLPKAH